MVPRIARGLAVKLPPAFELDDLISAGYLGLIAAADHYDPEKHAGTPFSAYARYRIRGAMLDSVRRGNYASVVGRVTLDQVPEPAIQPELETAIDDRRRAAAVAAAMGSLPRQQKTVIRRHYDAGDKLRRVARRLRVGKSRASQIHCEAVRALRVAVAGAS